MMHFETKSRHKKQVLMIRAKVLPKLKDAFDTNAFRNNPPEHPFTKEERVCPHFF
jgi:hypothetical protein